MASVTGTNGNDVIHVPFDHTEVPFGFNEIVGATNDADIIDGAGGDDRLVGGGGNDFLRGGLGADSLNGGSGTDTASYATSAGSVVVILGTGFASDGNSAIDGLSSIENVDGSVFDDFISGDGGANQLKGAGGNDSLIGEAGDDILVGAAGDDDLQGGVGADQLSGGLGIDTIRYFAMDVDGDGDLEGVRLTIGGSGSLGEAAGDTIEDSVENVIGTVVGDDIAGSAFDNVLDGNAGNDDLRGEGGNDTLIGGEGNDDLVGGAGADNLSGGAGIDEIFYSGDTNGVAVNLTVLTAAFGDAEGDVIAGDIENVTGGSGRDFLDGSAVDNALSGSGNNDILRGLAGNDTLIGGSGDDVLQGGTGADQLSGGSGIDAITFGGSAIGVTVDLTSRIAKDGDAQGDVLGTNHGIENIFGSNGDDTLTGSAVANTFFGDNGNDVLSGLDGDDILNGNGGDDVLRGGAGADKMDGGADGAIDLVTYFGAAAAVTVNLATGLGSKGDAQGDTYISIENVNGGKGGDSITGNAVANVLRGFEGNDILRGGAGADTLDGGLGTDLATYFGSTAAVTVDLASGVGSNGEAQGDHYTGIENVNGSRAGDSIAGNGLANVLNGFEGDDVLAGGGGTDTLAGGAGRDTLVGGAAADRFVFTLPSDSVVGAKADRIADFSHAQGDKIDLSQIDASTVAAGDQAFSFIGTAGYSGVAGQLRFAITAPGVTTIAGDVDGNGTSDFHITLTGQAALVAGDFVL